MRFKALPSSLGLAAGVGMALALAVPAGATYGYFSHGYGAAAEGMAGAAIAYSKDSLGLAANPASLTALGDRFDAGLDLFLPRRGAAIIGNAYGADATYDGSGVASFLMPSVGYVRQLSPQLAVGIAAYGNGGMNSSYDANPFARFGATGKAGVNLAQMFVSPAIAWRVADRHSIGVSVNLLYQMFKAEGVGVFAGYSQAPSAMTNRGTDSAFGWGLRIGYRGDITDDLTLGAFWQSKTFSGRFDKYAGLFAGQGSFDIPSSYGVGVAYKLTEALDVALDYERIDYGDVPAVGNALNELFLGHPFGADNGPGFGWRDIDVVKLGVNYAIDPHWQVRAGWGFAGQPIPSSQTFLNILAPGVVQNHVTLGATWSGDSGLEISGHLSYAPKTTVKGNGSIPSSFGGGEVNVHLSEVIFGLAVGWKL